LSIESPAILPVFGLAVLFLPNYLLWTEQRYFYPAFPFLYVLAVQAVSQSEIYRRPWLHQFGFVLLALAFLVPTFARSLIRPGSPRMAGECAYFLSEKIRSMKLAGPLAGSGRLPGGRAGLYVAFHLDQPWFGDEPFPTVEGFKSSRARLVIVNRASEIAQDLESSVQFRNIDPELFGPTNEARQFPLQVFQVASSGGRED
jgi:hypothetical protein